MNTETEYCWQSLCQVDAGNGMRVFTLQIRRRTIINKNNDFPITLKYKFTNYEYKKALYGLSGFTYNIIAAYICKQYGFKLF